MPPDQSRYRNDLGDEELIYEATEEREKEAPAKWKLRSFLSFLAFDGICSVVLLSPLIARVGNLEDRTTDHYTLHGSLSDLLIVAVPRILSAKFAILVSYHRNDSISESPFELFHDNGHKKSTTELEEEALGEPFAPKIRRFLTRPAFACELLCFATGALGMMKCLARLNVEIGVLRDVEPRHPLFWIALSIAAFCSLIEASFLESAETVANEWGRSRRRDLEETGQSGSWVERVGHNLTQPLLPRNEGEYNGEEEEQRRRQGGNRIKDRVRSDIGGDANYKASFSDLLDVSASDVYLILFASVFLVLSALCNTLVPHYTGKILDALVANSTDNNPDPADNDNGSGILSIPGFIPNIEKLVLVYQCWEASLQESVAASFLLLVRE